MAGPAMAADDGGSGRPLTISPSLSLQQTLSSNVDLRADNPESDAITRVTAGVSLLARGSNLRGFLDYSLSGVVYARANDKNELQNALNANLGADLLEGRLHVDASAGITRSAISAFGSQPVGAGDASANSTELRVLRLAPVLRGPLGPFLRYTASLSHSVNDAANTSLGDTATTNASLRLQPSSSGRLGWALDASQMCSDYKGGRTTTSERLFGSLLLDLAELDLQLNGNAGQERSNITSVDPRSYNTWGVGAVWRPSPITRVSADYDKRFFGNSHSVAVEYRLPRVVFSYRNARSLSTDGNQGVAITGAAFTLLDARLAAAQPGLSADERRQLVNQQLALLNIAPDRQINLGFLSAAVTLQDQQQLSVAWTNPRSAATLSWTRSSTRRLDNVVSVGDDLAGGDQIDLQGLSLSLSHRLTPMSTLALSLGSQRSSGGGAAQQGNHQRTAELLYSTRLTPESAVNVSLRRALSSNSLGPADESALTASYAVRF